MSSGIKDAVFSDLWIINILTFSLMLLSSEYIDAKA
jgi:hypothetical protein